MVKMISQFIYPNIYLTIFIFHSIFIGNLFKKLIFDNNYQNHNNLYLRFFFYSVIGILLNNCFLVLVGFLGALTKEIIFIYATVSSSILLIKHRYTLVGIVNKSEFFKGLINLRKSLNLILIIFLYFYLIQFDLRPPGFNDAAMYHLPIARFYAENHKIILLDSVRFPLFPGNIELLFSFGLMVGGFMLAQGLAILPIFVSALGLLGISVWITKRTYVGWIAICILLSLNAIKDTLGFAYIDNSLGLFSFASIISFMIWSENKKNYFWLFFLSAFSGFLCGIKYLAFFFNALIYSILFCIKESRKYFIISLLIAFLFGFWWYLRNYLISGDPMHPFGTNFLGAFLWNSDDLKRLYEIQDVIGVDKKFIFLFYAFYKSKTLILIPAFFSILAYKYFPRCFLYASIIFIFYSIIWFYTSQVDRYLAPILSIGSFLSSCLFFEFYFQIKNKLNIKLRFSNLDLLIKLLKIFFVFMLFVACLNYVHEKVMNLDLRLKRLQISHSDDPIYKLYLKANQINKNTDKKLFQFGAEGYIYYYNGQTIGEWFGPGRYLDFVSESNDHLIESPLKLIAFMKSNNANLLIVDVYQFKFNKKFFLNHFNVVEENNRGVLFQIK